MCCKILPPTNGGVLWLPPQSENTYLSGSAKVMSWTSVPGGYAAAGMS
jgi:hypothetical protein